MITGQSQCFDRRRCDLNAAYLSWRSMGQSLNPQYCIFSKWVVVFGGSENFNHIRKGGRDPHICKASGRVLGGAYGLLASSAPRPERCLLLKTLVYNRHSGVHSQDRQGASQLQYSHALSFISEVFKVHEMCFEFCWTNLLSPPRTEN